MPDPAGRPLRAERDGGLLVLTLDRPERLNALNDALLTELRAALEDARSDAAVRALVLTGSGRAFCAGADLAPGGAGEGAGFDMREHLTRAYAPVILAMRSIEKPIVAAINGVAAGAGMSIALAADLRVMADSATLIQAFVRVGLVPDAGSTFFLPRLVGLAAAAELAMLGDPCDADEARRIGLVNRVVPAARTLEAARELAERLARGPGSLGLIKRALSLSLTSDLATQLRHEADLQAQAIGTEDFGEGVAAFREKRPASFSGR